jgi:hypothetical protein
MYGLCCAKASIRALEEFLFCEQPRTVREQDPRLIQAPRIPIHRNIFRCCSGDFVVEDEDVGRSSI